MNTYTMVGELRSKVEDKVKQMLVNSLMEESPGNGRVAVFSVFSWRTGMEGIAGHLKIPMLMLGLVNESYL